MKSLILLLLSVKILFVQSISPHVLVMGDSITAWDDNYVDMLKKETTYTYTKAGYNGISTSGLLAKLKKTNLKKYDILIIEVGVNNLNDENNCANFAIKDIWEMINIAKNHNLQVIVLTIPPYKGYATWSPMRQSNLESINKWILSYSKDVFIAVDIYTPLSDKDRQKTDCTTDKLHPNKKGHEIICRQILNFI